MSASTKTQTIANHARYVPGFHFVTGSLNIGLLAWSVYASPRAEGSANAISVLVAALLLAQF